jgi:replicative DNA helicase
MTTAALHTTIARLEERLLGTWTRRPSLRAAWTPEPADFFTVKSQAVAQACRDVADLSGNDLGNAVAAALGRAGKLKLFELGAPVIDHQDETDPVAALDRWRELNALLRLHGGLATALAGIGASTDLGDLRGRILEALRASEAHAAVKSYSDSSLMAEALAAVTINRVSGHSTGFVELDRVTGGLRPGQVLTLGAPTNWGKSSWLLAVLDHHLRVHRRRGLLITCEDAPDLLATRLMCRRAGLPGGAARDGRLTSAQLALVSEEIVAAKERGDAPVMLDGRGRDVEHLAGDIRTAVRAHGISLVLVDYLQCIGSKRQTQDRRAEINHIARTLTDAIKTSGCAGVLASQLTGEDIRESRDVEHAAEVVLIGRKSEGGQMQVFVKKNKTGPKDAVIDLDWDERTGSFRTEQPNDYGFDDQFFDPRQELA